MQHNAGAFVAAEAPPRLRFGAFEVDLQASELRKNGERVRLEGQPFQILRILLERPGQLVTRDELQRQLWPADTFVDFELGINAAVRRLRQALEENAEAPRYVETLPRRGYRFVHPLDVAPAPAPVATTSWSGQRGAALIVGIFFVAMVGSVAFNVAGMRDRLVSTNASTPIRLAVLPLEDLTRGEGKELIAALHNQLITALTQIQAFAIVPVGRESVKRYKESDTPLADIGRALAVAAVLSGSVFQSGDLVTLNVSLTQTGSDHPQWAEAFNTDRASVLEQAGKIAHLIAAELHVRITPHEEALLSRARQVDPGAFELYLKGRYGGGKPDQRINYFNQAIKLDSRFALAWQELSNAWSLLLLNSDLRPIEAYAHAKDAARKALGLDDSLWRAHIALARIKYIYEWDWDGVPASRLCFRRSTFRSTATRRPASCTPRQEGGTSVPPARRV